MKRFTNEFISSRFCKISYIGNLIKKVVFVLEIENKTRSIALIIDNKINEMFEIT